MKTRSHFVSMRRPALLITLLVTVALILAACQSTAKSTATQVPAAPPPQQAPTDTAAPAATSAPMVEEPTIMVAKDAMYGNILVDSKGMTLYLFTKDTPGVSNCNAGCLAKWPPLLTNGSPKAGDGVDAAKLGSAKLSDGRMIVTYNGWPLYYWVNDTKPGDTSGQDVGGVWYVVSPDGMKIESAMEDTPTPTTAPAEAMMEPTIKVATDPILGQILVDGKGMTLYLFTKDTPGVSNCNAGCLAKWPPLLTEGSPVAGDGVDDSKLGTAKLADGRMIVTYYGWPLYYWVNDTKPGDTTGQDVGGVWYVVSPDGEKIEKSGEATINVATDPTFGKILVDGNGMTLYMFTKDGPNQSNCNDACLDKWPPLVTKGNPVLGEGVDPALVGTATLADGRMIVTYNGWPLYYWVNDAKAGDTTGQGVGSVWYVIGPDGKPIGQ